jgi:iron complex outermembrane receptor protein
LVAAYRVAAPILFALIPAMALAQGEQVAATDDSLTQNQGLQEIVVTAQRKSESLQKAAVPISVVGESDLAMAGVASPDALTATTTSLTAVPAGGSRMSFFMRGVGNFTNNPLFDSAIAFNYDNVYIGRPGGTAGVFYDLQRVEVLKGPQGTLYGRNATGGAINVLPVKPELDHFGGYLSGSYGNYGAYTFEGAINVPVGEEAALRISGNLAKHDGYLSDGTQDEDTKALRVQMLDNLTSTLSVRVAADYAHQGGAGSGSNYFSVASFDPATGTYIQQPTGLARSVGLYDPASQAFRSGVFAFPGGRTLGDLQQGIYNDNDFLGTNAEINWDTGAGHLTFIPAWRYTKQNNITALGGFPAGTQEHDRQYSFELRFVGNRIGMFDYQLGALSYHESNDGRLVADQQMISTSQIYDQTLESWATFARLTANLTDRFRVVGGLRYTHDDKHMVASSDSLVVTCTVATPPFCPAAPLIPFTWQVSDLASIGFPIPPPGGAMPAFNDLGVPTGALLVRPPVAVDQTQKVGKVTWRGATEFDLTPSSLLYVSVETGFRAGGVQPVNGYDTYRPEEVTAYTLGSKNRFLGNRLQANLEAFYWKYKDQQLAAIQADANGQQGFFVKNIGQTTMYGLDVDLVARATQTTTVTAQVEYLHTKYHSFVYYVPAVTPFGASPPPFTTCNVSLPANLFVVNCSGMPAYNAPTWTVNLGAEQIVPLGSHDLTFNLTSQYRSGRWTGFDFQPSQYQGGTWETNAQVSFGPQAGGWLIAGYVRNLENDRFVLTNNASAIGNLNTVIFNAPRTYGLRALVRF